MSTATFDTLSAARDLEAAGIERCQAEAIAEGMRRAAGVDRGELVTRGELYRASWIQAAALIGAQIAIAVRRAPAPVTACASAWRDWKGCSRGSRAASPRRPRSRSARNAMTVTTFNPLAAARKLDARLTWRLVGLAAPIVAAVKLIPGLD